MQRPTARAAQTTRDDVPVQAQTAFTQKGSLPANKIIRTRFGTKEPQKAAQQSGTLTPARPLATLTATRPSGRAHGPLQHVVHRSVPNPSSFAAVRTGGIDH